MAKKRFSITVEFPDETQQKDFIDCVKETDWKEWLDYKIIKNKPIDLLHLECFYQNVKKLIKDHDG